MIYGFLEDITSLLLWSYRTINLEYNTEIFFYSPLYFLSKYFDSIYLLSAFIFIILILNIFAFYKLYNKFFLNKLVSILVSLTTVFSPYMYYKSQNHPALVNIWIYSLFIYVLFFILNNKASLKKFGLFGLLLGFTGLISNYIFFFSAIFSTIFYLVQFCYEFVQERNLYTTFKTWAPRVIIFYIFLSLPFIYINMNFINANFFGISNDIPVNYSLGRPIEDFFIFSSRPWYYLLPSVDNPLLGGFSNYVIESLQSGWGSFLTKNYFKSEHSASYLGLVNLVIAFFGVLYLRKNNLIVKNYYKFLVLGTSGLILILFSLPPFIDLFGIRVYLPSYLISEYFSMFRVLARMGMLILIILLIFTGFGFLYLIDYLKKYNNNLISYSVITILTIISLVEFFIPIKLTDISQIPDVFQYIKESTSKESKVLIMPGNKNNLALFWSKDHNRELVILDNISIEGKLVSYDDFVNKYFYTCIGMNQLKNKGTNYLVYFYNSDSNSDSKREFLSQNLIKITEFKQINQSDELKTPLYRIIYTGNNFSNQSEIYKIPDNINCN